MNGSCDKLNGHLDAYLSGELPEQTRAEVQRHLADCAACSAELDALTRVRRQVKMAVRATPLPPKLEAEVRSAVRDRAAGRRSGIWAVAAAAAVIICAVMIQQLRKDSNPVQAILRKTSGRMAGMLNLGLRDHLECAVFRGAPIQPDPEKQIAADLGPDFAGLAPVLTAKLPPGFRILEGHHCSAGGRQFTHFIIAGGGKLISVNLTRKLTGDSLGGGLQQAGADRFQIVGFETGGYLAFVISDLDPVANLQWAAKLAPKVRDFLAGGGADHRFSWSATSQLLAESAPRR